VASILLRRLLHCITIHFQFTTLLWSTVWNSSSGWYRCAFGTSRNLPTWHRYLPGSWLCQVSALA